MKKLLMLLFIIFLSPTAPVFGVYDEESGAELVVDVETGLLREIKTLSCSQKFLRLLRNLGGEAAHWVGNHKKTITCSTLTLCALATMYYTFVLGDESLMGTSPVDPCMFNSDGVFDIHACAHYLESSIDTSTLNLFLDGAQKKLVDVWESVSDREMVQTSLIKIWESLQNDHCHVHDEL